MLDSDTCIEIIRGDKTHVDKRYRALLNEDSENKVVLSAIVYAEIAVGQVGRARKGRPQAGVDEFLTSFETIPWDKAAAAMYATIRDELERRGLRIGTEDMMIAAHAIITPAILVTNNTSRFDRLSPPLRLENWIAS
ncbi:MAG: type II toxin-antitoxin system VapC family toxin [Thermomicrobiales bacterium]